MEKDISKSILTELYNNKFVNINLIPVIVDLVECGHTEATIQHRLSVLHEEKFIVVTQGELSIINVSSGNYQPLNERTLRATLTHNGEVYYYDRFLSIWAKIKHKDPNAISTMLNIIGFGLIVISVIYAIISYHK